MKKAWLTVMVMVVLGACGDDHRGADVVDTSEVGETDAVADTVEDIGVDGVADTDAVADIADVDDGADSAADTAVEDVPVRDTTGRDTVLADGVEDVADSADTTDAAVETVDTIDGACPSGAACNALLDDAGRCPGDCIAQPQRLACTGVVVDDVCMPYDPRTIDPPISDFGTFRVTIQAAPTEVVAGETSELRLKVDNKTGSDITIALQVAVQPSWELPDANFAGVSGITVAAHASYLMTGHLRATRPDLFDMGGDIAVALYFDEQPLLLHATAVFPDDAGPACGAHHFPPTYCRSEPCGGDRVRYDSAVCCDDVFFPGAACCDDAGCPAGACVDGACVDAVPHLNSANTLPHGTQSILLVLADFPDLDVRPAGASPCEDRADALRGTLQLDVVDAFYRDHSRARTGRDLSDFRWTVLDGIDSDDFVPPDGDHSIFGYRDALVAHLAALGCPAPSDFDKLVMTSPKIDLQGFGGQYVNDGLVAIGNWMSPQLIAHELGHSFGALDLYFDLGGTFVRPLALMADHLLPDANDQVMWGEVGWGDSDRDGVIDVFEFAAYPESLAVVDLAATVGPNAETLVITFQLVGHEGGRDLQIPTLFFDYALPEHGFSRTGWADGKRVKRLEIERSELDWNALKTRGTIDLALVLVHDVTLADGTRRHLRYDETTTVPVSGL